MDIPRTLETLKRRINKAAAAGFGAWVDVEGIESQPDGSAYLSVRNFGNWEMPSDASDEDEDAGDYDWKVPTARTRAMLDSLVKEYTTPDVKVTWFNQGEKNWITFIATKAGR